MSDMGFRPRTAPAGFIIGLLVGGLVMLMAGFVMIRAEKEKVRRGWTLEYVITAARPIEAGTILDMDMIQQQPMPEQFVTGSLVRPDEIREAIELRVRDDLARGDLLMWALLESPGAIEVAEEAVEEGESSAETEGSDW